MVKSRLILTMAMLCFAIVAVNPNSVCGQCDDCGESILKRVAAVKRILTNVVIPKLDGDCKPCEPCEVSVPKTGQTISYESGDDGDLQMGTAWPNPRFTDNRDGTVTDNFTGLMWTKDANIYGQRIWSDALSDCASCTEGGYDDWRLPNARELYSLSHFGYYNPALPDTAGTGQWSEGDPFTDVQSSYYWSATTFAGPADRAWDVDMYYGRVGGGSKSNGGN